MPLYQRISEIQPTSSERAARLLRECRPLFNILPLRRRAVSIDNILTVSNASQFRLFAHLLFKVRTEIRCGFHLCLKLERGARIILAGDSQCFWFFSTLLAQLHDDGFHPSNPSCFDGSIWHSPQLWLLRLRSQLLCLSRCLLNGACQSCPALCFLYLIIFTGNS